MAKLQKGSKKLLNAWAFYDWANSVYTLNYSFFYISNILFGIFYRNKTVEAFGFEFKSTALITL